MNEELYEKAAELLGKSRKTVALTGAGISTPSGIADFRSPGCGLWEKIDPIEVATIDSFRRTPEKFLSFMGPLANVIAEAQPNPAHTTLADWERRKLLHSVITQNIDNLHQKAGSVNVLEVHGNAAKAHCFSCGEVANLELLSSTARSGNVPRCECGGVIKPDVILFGESLPFRLLEQAQMDAQTCDVMIVVGSSLTVMPVSMLPQMAVQSGASLIIVNIQPTYIDRRAAVALHEKVEIALPKISELIKR